MNLAIQDGALTASDLQRRPSQRLAPGREPREKISKRRQFVRDFCPPLSDFARGVGQWVKRIPSDYKDAFKKEYISIVLGSVMFLYFVNMAPTITFAALLSK